MPALRLAIIADDLSGALDAAAPFAAAGVVVATAPAALDHALAQGPGVVAVSTRSRDIGAGEARDWVAGVLATLPAGARLVKKIDSRLKGNIAAELAAFGDRPMVVLPAIPEFGRVVRDGRVQGFGVAEPIDVRSVLGRAAAVPDTGTAADMVRAVASAGDAVLVGALGMARALAAQMALGAPAAAPALAAPLCIAVGSTDPITLAQVAALRAARPDLVHVAAPGGLVPPPEGAPAPLTLLQAVPGEPLAPHEVAARFAAGVAPWLRAARSMLLTGGATAEAVLDALGIAVLQVAGEALPGMPCCRAGGQLIVTKSGGFGAPDALVRLAG